MMKLQGRGIRGWSSARITLFLVCCFLTVGGDHCFVQATITASGRTSRGREVFFFDSMPADFGMEIPLDSPVQVQLKHLPERPYLCSSSEDDNNRLLQSELRVDDLNGTDASSTIDTSISNTSTTETGLPVALLVYRGNCTFEVKAQQAALLKIPYLIVADMNEEDSDLITMNASPSETTKDVGLLFVTWQTGVVLNELLDHADVTIGDHDDNTVILNIDGKIPPGGEEDTLANLVLRLFIWVGIITFCFAPRGHLGIPGLSSTSPLTEEQVLKLPTVKHGDTDGEEDDQHNNEEACCSICLEEYTQDEMLRQLPCHHEFHTECIVQWLTRSQRHGNCCPLCKQEVTLEDDHGVNSKKWWRLPTSWRRRRQGRILVSTSEQQNDDAIELAVTGLD